MGKAEYLSESDDLRDFHPYPTNPSYLVHRDGRIVGKKNYRLLGQSFYHGTYKKVCIDCKAVPVGTVMCETFHGPRPTRDSVVIYTRGPKFCGVDDVRWGTRKESHDRRMGRDE